MEAAQLAEDRADQLVEAPPRVQRLPKHITDVSLPDIDEEEEYSDDEYDDKDLTFIGPQPGVQEDQLRRSSRLQERNAM